MCIKNYWLTMDFIFQDSVYLPGDPLEDDQELEFDKSAYEMYHEVFLWFYFANPYIC